jgi:hypothetical protein
VSFTVGARSCRLFHWQVFGWLARYFQETGVPLEQETVQARLHWQVDARVPELPDDLTPRRWQAFLTDYLALMELKRYDLGSPQEVRRQQTRLFEKYQLRLPDDILEDSHSAQCRLCLAALFQYSYRVEGFEAYHPFQAYLVEYANGSNGSAAGPLAISPYTLPAFQHGEVIEQLGFLLRVARAHVAPFAEAEVQRFWQGHARGWTWEQWYRAFPAERCDLPRIWHPTYGRDFSARDLLQPDWQVITEAIPRSYVLGAIKLSDGEKLLPQVRPNRRRGETLNARLWRVIHEMRASYQGEPLVW